MGTSESAHEKFSKARGEGTGRSRTLVGTFQEQLSARNGAAGGSTKYFRVLEREMKQARARFENEGDGDQIDFKL